MDAKDRKLVLVLVDEAQTRLAGGTGPADPRREENIRDVKKLLRFTEMILSGRATDKDKTQARKELHPSGKDRLKA